MTGLALCCLVALSPAAFAGPVLRDFQGSAHELEEYLGQGKWLIVMIWASDCPVCNAEAPGYVAFHGRHAAKDARVLGLSVDGIANKSEALRFVQEHSIDFPNLIAGPEAAAELYVEHTGTTWIGTPSFLIFTPQGNLRTFRAGALSPAEIEQLMRQP